VVDVVEEPDGDAALHGREERREHEPACVRLEADVVQRDVEGVARLGEEEGDASRDFGWALPAVRERRQLDRRRRLRALRQVVLRSEAL
jgi:hypothetical protein